MAASLPGQRLLVLQSFILINFYHAQFPTLAGAVPGPDTGGIALAKPSGRGVLTSPEGRYEGAFADGLPHGQGRFTPVRGTAVLSGAWLYGSHVWPAADGEVFVGAIDATGQPSGAGYCHAGDGAQLHRCRRGDDHSKPTASKQ